MKEKKKQLSCVFKKKKYLQEFYAVDWLALSEKFEAPWRVN